MISLHGAATTVPNRNGKQLLGLLIASGASWAEGVDIVLCVKTAALLYENIGLSGFPYILSRVTVEECLTLVFWFLRDIPMVVVQEKAVDT